LATEATSRVNSLQRTDGLRLYRRMAEIRAFEDRIMELFTRNLVRGSTHLCQGQEAVSVGVAAALRPGDTMTCTYRGHGAILAFGAPLDRTMAEILGKADGLCGGKGGSMHLAAVSLGALGSFAIVGANLPVTVGAAFTAKYRATGAVSVAFFGDGATNIGAVHEALNLAAIWKLPAIFVCENNLYGEYSPLASTTPVERLSDRASSYAMPAEIVDGNDVLAMRDAAAAAAERARANRGPTFIEALTYRHLGHSRSDPATYRPEGELERWRSRDPLTLFRRALIDGGVASEDELDGVLSDAKAAVDAATERAMSWEPPTINSRLDDVYA
jgi:TPP-dependent pyruvate/acetoin dehydrogenase alpha subunit